MAEAFNILPYVKTPDFVSPLEAALRMHESRQNAETQRMYAQNQMARESAQEFRENRDYEEKQKDKERQDKLEAAKAVGTISQMLGPRDEKGRPVNLGPAMALGSVYGIDLHPLLATTAAAHAAQGDAVDQALAEAGPTGNAPQAPPAAPGGDSSIPRETPGVDPGVAAIMQGRTVQSAPEGDFVLPPGTPANLAAASAHTGYVPQGSELLPPQARPPAPPPPVPAGPPPELEALMAGAHPEFAGAKYEAPTNPLYEAVMGGQHYQLGGQASGEVLGGKYDTIAQALISRGIPAKDAYVKALAEKEKDDSIAATAQRMKDALAGHNAETDKRDAGFKKTVDQQLSEADKNRANARSVAAIRAASGGATPAQENGLAELLRMKEGGSDDSEIATRAAELKIPEKAWRSAVKNVQAEAVSGNRATEKRAGLEYTDENGKVIGTAKTPQAAATLSKQTSAWGQLKNRYQALIDDVKQNGARVNPLDLEATQRRDSLAAAAAAAARVYNGLGATDASQKLEAEILGARGTFGHGIVKGANPAVLQHVFDEAASQHQVRLHEGLRAGGGAPLPKAISHDKGAAGGGAPDLDALEKWSAGLGK